MFVENGPKIIAFEQPFNKDFLQNIKSKSFCNLKARYPEGSESGKHKMQHKESDRSGVITNIHITEGSQ